MSEVYTLILGEPSCSRENCRKKKKKDMIR